jgi:hypothetical protein
VQHDEIELHESLTLAGLVFRVQLFDNLLHSESMNSLLDDRLRLTYTRVGCLTHIRYGRQTDSCTESLDAPIASPKIDLLASVVPVSVSQSRGFDPLASVFRFPVRI